MTTKILKAIEEFEAVKSMTPEWKINNSHFMIAHSNNATKFTQALKVAVETLEQYRRYHPTASLAIEALTEIERILSE